MKLRYLTSTEHDHAYVMVGPTIHQDARVTLSVSEPSSPGCSPFLTGATTYLTRRQAIRVAWHLLISAVTGW